MGDDEARAGGPWIDGKAAKAPQLADALAIDDVERQTELAFELVLPLHRHCRRRCDDDEVDAAPQQQLAGDEPGLDRLAEADVVGNQEIDAGQSQRLAKRQQLIGIKPMPARKGAWSRSRSAAVAERQRIARKCAARTSGLSGRAAPDTRPSVLSEDGGADFGIPQDFDLLALRVVGNAGEPDGGEARL